MHWTADHLGRADLDCAGLVELVQRERYGRDVVLPRPRSTRARDAEARALTGVLWTPSKAPREGDAVLMRAAGRRVMSHHVGVYCEPGGVPSVLHALEEVGVCLHRLADLPGRGLELEGVYAWIG